MLNALLKCRLFEGMTAEEISVTAYRFGRTAFFPEGSVIMREGEECPNIGILISGEVAASSSDRWGKPTPVTRLLPGHLFGDVLAAGGGRVSPITLRAISAATVLFIPFAALLDGDSAGTGGQKLYKNLSAIISEKYFELFNRIRCLTAPTLRDKIYTMLYHYGKPGETFSMPMDREKMAAYLDCDRSALSRELSKMKAEGVVDFYKNTFRLISIDRNWE